MAQDEQTRQAGTITQAVAAQCDATSQRCGLRRAIGGAARSSASSAPAGCRGALSLSSDRPQPPP